MKRTGEMRRFVDSVMTCTGKVTRPGEGWVIDPETGYEVPAPPVVIFDDKCLVYPADRDAVVVDVGGQSVPKIRYNVMLPAGSVIEIGDVLVVTSSPDNPNMVDISLRIVDAPLDAWEVARHVMAEAT